MSLLDRFPSFAYVYKNGIAALGRFPFSLLCALIGTIMAFKLVDSGNTSGELIRQKILMVAALGLPLFISLAVYSEKRQWPRKTALAFQAVGLVLLIAYYYSLPSDVSYANKHIVRFLLLNIGLHLLVAFIPYIGKNKIDSFWQYNKSLFLRFLISALYSAVMYIGLVIALAAADHLFGFNIKEIRYFQLWVLIAGLFNTWIFLAGIPKIEAVTGDSPGYPVGLKLFTQYILLPLVVLYFVILITYEGKIIFTWNWPKGWVSHLVLWYSVVGILSMLLLHPLKDLSGNRWIQVFSKWFFRAMIPLVVMLILAILKRISDYGITENRYFVAGMALELSLLVIYFVLSKSKDIRIIPIMIFCGALLSAYGPWSAFSISERSQRNRLERYLQENDMLENGRIITAAAKIDIEDRKNMSSIITYLAEWHGTNSFSNWIADSSLVSIDTLTRYSRPMEIAELMGFEYLSHWKTIDIDGRFYLNSKIEDPLLISEYDYLIELEDVPIDDFKKSYLIGDDSCFVDLGPDDFVLRIRFNNEPEVLELQLADRIIEIINSNYLNIIPSEKMTFLMPGTNLNALFIITNARGAYEDNAITDIRTLEGRLLIQKTELSE